jgi:predicted TIM-barrel fold metal-dependent hydrolase
MTDLAAQIPILDTHQHLIYPDTLRYSWTDGIPPLAAKGFRHHDYITLVAGKGVAGTIFMETDPDDGQGLAEAKLVYRLADESGSVIRGVIATCRPERDSFREQIDALRHPKLVGLRRILHVMPDELSRQTGFVNNVRWLGTQAFTFDLCFLARQLPIALELAQKCDNVQLILDHCGVPDIAAGALDPWREHITQLAALPNVACKISGVPTYCKAGSATIDAVKPYVDHCIESFGADRLVWGGDWPVVNINASLPAWIDMTRQLVARLSDSEQRKLLHDNAVRIYRLKPGA